MKMRTPSCRAHIIQAGRSAVPSAPGRRTAGERAPNPPGRRGRLADRLARPRTISARVSLVSPPPQAARPSSTSRAAVAFRSRRALSSSRVDFLALGLDQGAATVGACVQDSWRLPAAPDGVRPGGVCISRFSMAPSSNTIDRQGVCSGSEGDELDVLDPGVSRAGATTTPAPPARPESRPELASSSASSKLRPLPIEARLDHRGAPPRRRSPTSSRPSTNRRRPGVGRQPSRARCAARPAGQAGSGPAWCCGSRRERGCNPPAARQGARAHRLSGLQIAFHHPAEDVAGPLVQNAPRPGGLEQQRRGSS